MPKKYEAMRDKFKRQGMSDSGAKGKAARIWNSQNPGNPVGPHQHEKKRERPKADKHGYF
jgi:hypothetical protein